MNLTIKDTFNKELPADPDMSNTRRQVFNAFFSHVIPRVPSNPKIVHVSHDMACSLGLDEGDVRSDEFLKVFSGSEVLQDTHPYSMCYGGHQFGHWAGQLGDGRAINLAEVEHEGQAWALQLKGSGETPYSRTADGLAVLRSSIREHLCSEAMFHLEAPTTRSLSVMLTGDHVMRDILYDGHPALEKGAVVCRVAPSFIRFGNFEIFASRGDMLSLQQLADHTIAHFYPDATPGTKDGYLRFFQEVAHQTLSMILHWQRVGFVHGVMNTDNMSILGLTIDYGPYGWLEGYDPNWTPNTTDRERRRYRYGNQPQVALWNLWQLANALFPLIGEAAPLENILEQFRTDHALGHVRMMRQKLGLLEIEASDEKLITQLEHVLQLTETDMTIFYRKLADLPGLTAGADERINVIEDAFYKPEELEGAVLQEWHDWLEAYIERLAREKQSSKDRGQNMNSVNPKYVLRNYMAQLAIDAAENHDFSVVEELYELLRQPYAEQPEHEKWFVKRPEWARNKVGCSMLSCSS